MTGQKTGTHGSSFSTLELMTVAAVITTLSAIAIPNLYNAQLRAKRVEIVANVEGIRDAVLLYAHTMDALPSGSHAFHPAAAVGKTASPWSPGSKFDVLGWRPDGAVYGRYSFANTYTWAPFCQDRPANTGERYFEVLALADLDADGHVTYHVASDTERAMFCHCDNFAHHHGPDEVW